MDMRRGREQGREQSAVRKPLPGEDPTVTPQHGEGTRGGRTYPLPVHFEMLPLQPQQVPSLAQSRTDERNRLEKKGGLDIEFVCTDQRMLTDGVLEHPAE